MFNFLKSSALLICLMMTATPLQAACILVIGDSWGVAAGPAGDGTLTVEFADCSGGLVQSSGIGPKLSQATGGIVCAD